MKHYDIFIGRIDGWHTFRIAHRATEQAVVEWLQKGYRIETEHQIGLTTHEVYLVKA